MKGSSTVPARQHEKEVDNPENEAEEYLPPSKKAKATGSFKGAKAKRGRPKVVTGVNCGLCGLPKANRLTNSKHFFSEGCITEWLKDWNVCPKCRSGPVTTEIPDFN